jgi:hypothetical protein
VFGGILARSVRATPRQVSDPIPEGPYLSLPEAHLTRRGLVMPRTSGRKEGCQDSAFLSPRPKSPTGGSRQAIRDAPDGIEPRGDREVGMSPACASSC